MDSVWWVMIIGWAATALLVAGAGIFLSRTEGKFPSLRSMLKLRRKQG